MGGVARGDSSTQERLEMSRWNAHSWRSRAAFASGPGRSSNDRRSSRERRGGGATGSSRESRGGRTRPGVGKGASVTASVVAASRDGAAYDRAARGGSNEETSEGCSSGGRRSTIGSPTGRARLRRGSRCRCGRATQAVASRRVGGTRAREHPRHVESGGRRSSRLISGVAGGGRRGWRRGRRDGVGGSAPRDGEMTRSGATPPTPPGAGRRRSARALNAKNAETSGRAAELASRRRAMAANGADPGDKWARRAGSRRPRSRWRGRRGGLRNGRWRRGSFVGRRSRPERVARRRLSKIVVEDPSTCRRAWEGWIDRIERRARALASLEAAIARWTRRGVGGVVPRVVRALLARWTFSRSLNWSTPFVKMAARGDPGRSSGASDDGPSSRRSAQSWSRCSIGSSRGGHGGGRGGVPRWMGRGGGGASTTPPAERRGIAQDRSKSSVSRRRRVASRTPRCRTALP